MSNVKYRIIAFRKRGDGPDGRWNGIFPEFPGCTSAGATREEVLENGQKALADHVHAMIVQGFELPAPSRMNVQDPRWVEELIDMVDRQDAFLAVPGRSVRINITMDETLIERLDASARREGTTRSGYLAQAVREKLQRGREMA